MKRKLAIVMAGGGAAGKSTTTKAFVNGNPNECHENRLVESRIGLREMKVSWTIYDNCGLAGNHKSGTDANNGPGATKSAFFTCLQERNIAIVDGMVSTPKWVLMCNEWQKLHPKYRLGILVLHFDLPAEILLERLAKRREVDKESIREKMWDKCRGLVRRAEILVNHFDELCELPMTVLSVYEDDTTTDIVKLMNEQVTEYFNEIW